VCSSDGGPACDASFVCRSSSSNSGTNSSKSGASDGLYGGSIYSDGAPVKDYYPSP